jgi:hypothetical protein
MEINQMPIAMAYVPWQKWQDLYEAPKALMRGTIFAQLDKPFTGRQPMIEPRRGGCKHECR